jgi:phosphoenolpyruvate carboxykinase (GTP)
MESLKSHLGDEGYQKINRINNPELNAFLTKYIELCKPESVFVCTDDPRDIEYIRDSAIRNGEELQLATQKHTASARL